MPETKRYKALVADASPFTRKVIRQFLMNENLEIVEAETAEDAKTKIFSTAPDLLIAESGLYSPSGGNLVEAARHDSRLKNMAFVMIRDEKKDADFTSTLEDEGRIHIVFKPFDGEAIRDAARKALHIEAPENRRSEENQFLGAFDAEGFSESDFLAFRDFLMSKVGLYFDVKRRVDLARALARRMKAIGITKYREYFEILSHSSFEEKELKNLILHLTIGETTFFRSPDQFAALRQHIIPKLIEARRGHGMPSIKIWSAGCSTGEEPYSLAITLKENIPDIDRWDVTIHATDINHKFLSFAERGVYPARKVKFVNDDILGKYFKFEKDGYAVSPDLRKYIKFSYHNLGSETFSSKGGMDVIFCRNVLIYFKRDRIKEVIDKFRDNLNQGGFLMLGYSETLFQISDDFESIHFGDAFFYRMLTPAEKEEAARKNYTKDLVLKDLPPKRLQQPPPAPAREKTPMLVAPTRLPPVQALPIPTSATPPPTFAKPVPPPEEPVSELDARRDVTELSLWDEGMEEYFNENFVDAEKTFSRLSIRFPNSARARLGEAFILANRGDDSHAAEMLKKAIATDDLLPEAYYLRALLNEKEGDVEGAVRDYRNVILLDPEFAMAHFNLAILYMKRGKFKDSRREFQNTLDILEKYELRRQVKFSGGLHRDALMQLCRDMAG